MISRINMGDSNFSVPRIILGCMRICDLSLKEAQKLINCALDLGVNMFDHADIYGGGEVEGFFAKATNMSPSVREKIMIQTKCGICPDYYDLSAEHIIKSAESSLKKLKTDYIDLFLLHRPDALADMEEVAKALEKLLNDKKILNVGVSNFNPLQIQRLKKYLNAPILANQLQLSITESGMIDCGLNVNMKTSEGINRDDSVLDFCILNNITVQAWSPFQYGFFEGVYLDNPKFENLNIVLQKIADKYNTTKEAVSIAWILRLPANIQTVVGTTNVNRLQQICCCEDFELTRQEWYEIYISAGKKLP